MITLDVEGDSKKIIKDIGFVAKDIARKAQIRSVNRVVNSTTTRAQRYARDRLKGQGVKISHIRPKVRKKRALFYSPVAKMFVMTGGVSAYKTGQQPVPPEFIATMRSGKKGIWRRTGRKTSKGKNQIAEKVIAIVPGLMDGYETYLRTFSPAQYRKEFTRDLLWRLRTAKLLM